MPIEKSAGAIVFWRSPKGEIKYLLLRRQTNDWVFPKGLIESGEKPEETALREVKEETGLKKLEFIPGFKETIKFFFKVKYPYQLKKGLKKGQRVLKFVTYFLCRAKDKKVKISFEHQGYRWFSFKEALKQLKKYRNNQEILKKAQQFLTYEKKKNFYCH